MLPSILASARIPQRWRAALATALLLAGFPAVSCPGVEPELAWHDLRATCPIEGAAWPEAGGALRRLPARAQESVRPEVWQLAQHTSGLHLRFLTDAPTLVVRWTLDPTIPLAKSHMPATGVSGLDLYVRDAGAWRWLAVARPDKAGENESTLFDGLSKTKREYLLYFPLFNRIEGIKIGISRDAVVERAPAAPERRPIVVYGTSIVQGGCASRPGMAYPSILSRRLDWPVVNLGFSGNGRMEPEMAQLLAGLEPAAYLLDCLPNLDLAGARERVEPFIRKLRENRPQAPVILIENIHYPDAALSNDRRVRANTVNELLREMYERLKKGGDKNLHYVSSAALLGGDGEDTVDGTHPTDLGFVRMADGIEPILRQALAAAGTAQPGVEPGFESLFDGKTLSGWKPHDEMPPIHRGAKWEVTDGVIVGSQDPPGTGGLLWLERPFMDFILKFEIQLTYPMDTGVFLRVGPTALSHQVCLDYRPGSDVGAIFIPFVGHRYVSRFSDGARFVKPEGWNEVEVRMEGEPARIRVWLNSRLLTDFMHTEATTRSLPEQGGLAFQVHPDVEGITAWGRGNTVRLRNIRIRELPRAK